MKLHNIIKFRNTALLVGISCLANIAYTQDAEEATKMGTATLRTEALSLVNDKKYVQARPYLEELVKRIVDSDDAKLKSNLPELSFFLAYGYLQDYGTNQAVESLDKALAGFDTIIRTYPNTEFALPAIKAKASCYDALAKPVEAANTRAILLRPPFVSQLNLNEQLALISKISNSLYNAREWESGQIWFEALLAHRYGSLEDKSFAASALIQCLINKKEYKDAQKYFQYMVHNYPSRFDISLNLSFLNAGDELVKQEKYSEAMMFYSMVLDKEIILKNLNKFAELYNKEVDRLKRMAPNSNQLVEMQGKQKLNEHQIKVVEEIQSFTVDLKIREARNYLLTKRDYESFWSYYELVKTLPDNENIEDFYFAAIVVAQSIDKWEQLHQLATDYMKEFDYDGMYSFPIALSNAQYYLNKGDKDEFFKIAEYFLTEFPDEPQGSDFVYLMGKTWSEEGNYDKLIKNFREYIERDDLSPIVEGCLYWIGLAHLAKSEFAEAQKAFTDLLEDFEFGPYSEDATYRKGVAAFGAGDYEEARDTLEQFIEDYPESQTRGEVEYFLGDIYAGVGTPEATTKALEHYMQVENFTDLPSFVDGAYLQSGELLLLSERNEELVALMDTYIKKFPNNEASKALSLKSKALEKLGLPADALEVYKTAIQNYANNPKDEGADKIILDYDRLYKENLEKLNATIAFLEKAISDKKFLREMVEIPALRYRFFRDNPKVDQDLYEKFKRDEGFGVNLYKDKTNLTNLLNKSKQQLAKYPEGGSVAVFEKLYALALKQEQETAIMRLMMALDMLGKPVELKKVFSEEDIKKASVRNLVWVGKQNEKYGADAARSAYMSALERDEYDYIIDVLFAIAQLEEKEGNWEDVIRYYTKIENDFPAHDRAAEAAIKHADALMKLKNGKDKAKEKYENVLKVPSWRGEAYAEVLYKLGLFEEAQGNNDQALMWLDRCYLGFSNCYDWTGKALLAAAKIYEKQSKFDEAKKICDEFLENPRNKAVPEYKEIQEYRKTL